LEYAEREEGTTTAAVLQRKMQARNSQYQYAHAFITVTTITFSHDMMGPRFDVEQPGDVKFAARFRLITFRSTMNTVDAQKL
jgi:hypothetical protein